MRRSSVKQQMSDEELMRLLAQCRFPVVMMAQSQAERSTAKRARQKVGSAVVRYTVTRAQVAFLLDSGRVTPEASRNRAAVADALFQVVEDFRHAWRQHERERE
jgi:hypothetical protein